MLWNEGEPASFKFLSSYSFLSQSYFASSFRSLKRNVCALILAAPTPSAGVNFGIRFAGVLTLSSNSLCASKLISCVYDVLKHLIFLQSKSPCFRDLKKATSPSIITTPDGFGRALKARIWKNASINTRFILTELRALITFNRNPEVCETPNRESCFKIPFVLDSDSLLKNMTWHLLKNFKVDINKGNSGHVSPF